MMTKDEFQKKYYEYQTDSKEEAIQESIKVNLEGIERDAAIPIKLGDLRWCLMLMSAALFAEKSGIIPPQILAMQAKRERPKKSRGDYYIIKGSREIT